MKKPVKILLILIVIALISATYFLLTHKKVDKNELKLFGNVEIRQVDLGFRVEGKVTKMFYEEGDAVKKGDLLAYLDGKTYQASFEKSAADIEKNKAANVDAEEVYARHLPLCSDSTTSKQECDKMFNNKNQTKAAMESSVAQNKYDKTNLDDTKLYAPEEGIITTRIQEPGAVVSPAQPIYTLSINKPVWIRTYVSETSLANIKYGMKARVLTDTVDPKTGKNREYQGWVGYISPVAEFTPKTVQTEDLRTDLVYRIRVYVYDIDKYLRQGMPTTIKIDLVQDEQR